MAATHLKKLQVQRHKKAEKVSGNNKEELEERCATN